MHREPKILVNHLSYAIPNSLVQFQGLTLSFEQKRYGIVGNNGIGKTTLLKLIANLIPPNHGSVQNHGSLLYCPQNYKPSHLHETVAETLGIAKKLQALKHIQQGNFSEADYAIIGDEWDIETRVKKSIADFDLQNIALERELLSLSGGQQTKCLLIHAVLSNSDFILFDEPTNNLDSLSRNKFHQWLAETKKGILIVSHDLTLLDQMDEIIEITTHGLNHYGGNYSFYKEQKVIQQQSLEKELIEAKRKIKITAQSVQETREKHEKNQAKGKRLRKNTSQSKLILDKMKSSSEKTQSKNTIQSRQMIQKVKKSLNAVSAQLETTESISADLSATYVPSGKTVIEINQMYFGYAHELPLFENFNLSITDPERIAIEGNNGSGKTTLIKLICGDIQPNQGSLRIGVNSICYLDQHVRFLNSSLSLIENFQQLNPEINTQEAYFALASFNFRNKATEKLIGHLSGGERIRAGLAISLLSKTPPQLIVLDEPTNHLDLHSIEAIEHILNAYAGAMIVISHDQHFLKNIGVHRKIEL